MLDTKNIHDLKNDPNPTLMELYLDLKKYITPVQPLEFNVLAIAVPKLSAKESKPQLPTLQDLFNTFMAGFHLAAELAAGSPNTKRAAINTGPIGTGDFNNNKYVVWVLQLLAASQKGVNLHFWGYNKDEDSGAREDLEKILKEFTNNGHTTIAQLLDDASKVTWPHY